MLVEISFSLFQWMLCSGSFYYDNEYDAIALHVHCCCVVSVGVSFFQLEWNVSVSECFGVPFRSCTVHIYIQQT